MPFPSVFTTTTRYLSKAAASLALLACSHVGAQQAIYTLEADIVGAGTIINLANGGYLFCTASGEPLCTTTYAAGTRITLKASPSVNTTFYGWGGDCAGTVGRECTIVMDSDKFVSAAFDPNVLTGRFNVHIQLNGNGAVGLSPDDADGYNWVSHDTADTSYKEEFRYDADATATFRADPTRLGKDSRHVFVGWGGACAGAGTGPCTLKINSNKHIEATFAQPTTGGAGSCLSRYFTPDEELVQDIYVAYYGRPGDPRGLNWWNHELKAVKGDAAVIMNPFGNSLEYRNRFAALSNPDLVHNLFQQMFGRQAEQAGLDFYVNGLNSGQYTLASIALTVLVGTNPNDRDGRVLENRRKAARHYTTTAEATGNNKLSPYYLADLLSKVGEDEASLNAVCQEMSDALLR